MGFLVFVSTATIPGRLVKRVTCEKCACEYRYELRRAARTVSFIPLVTALIVLACAPMLLMLVAPIFFAVIPVGGGFIFFLRIRTGGGNAGAGLASTFIAGKGAGEEAATSSAIRKLRRRLERAVEPVACPDCGWYQGDMVRECRGRVLTTMRWIALDLLVASQAAVAAVLYIPAMKGRISSEPVREWAVITAVGLAAAMAMLAIRWIIGLTTSINRPSSLAAIPDAPPAVRKSDHDAEMAASVARITHSRGMSAQPRITARVVPRRSLPAPPPGSPESPSEG
jgi:hypothetical protein